MTDPTPSRPRDALVIDAVRRDVVDGPGSTPAALRTAVLDDREVPPEVAAYVRNVRHRSRQVAQTDVDALREAGLGEDEMFELTVLAAVGAANEILDRTLDAIKSAGG